MRANWGPGTHLTTACLPFLQGVTLLGIDSWARHSDRAFSVPRQWTFSTQNPFFFDMRLSLERSKVCCRTVLKEKALTWSLVQSDVVRTPNPSTKCKECYLLPCWWVGHLSIPYFSAKEKQRNKLSYFSGICIFWFANVLEWRTHTRSPGKTEQLQQK